MEKSDLLFYLGWGFAIVFLGLTVALGLSGNVDWLEAVLLWLMLVGFLMIGLGMGRTREAPRGSMFLAGVGGLVAVLSAGLLATALELFEASYGIAIIIVALGMAIIVMGLARFRSPSKPKSIQAVPEEGRATEIEK